jgi:hypothetical protein
LLIYGWLHHEQCATGRSRLAAEDYSHWQAWLQLFWAALGRFFVAAAVAALLVDWWSKQSLQNAAKLPAAFLAMIVILMETTAVSELLVGERYGQLVLMGRGNLASRSFLLGRLHLPMHRVAVRSSKVIDHWRRAVVSKFARVCAELSEASQLASSWSSVVARVALPAVILTGSLATLDPKPAIGCDGRMEWEYARKCSVEHNPASRDAALLPEAVTLWPPLFVGQRSY